MGTGIGKIRYRKTFSEPVSVKFGIGKKSWNRYRKNLVPKNYKELLEVGPSVKFVSPISGLISGGKNEGKFFSRKKYQTLGGGVRGGDGKKPYVFPLFLSPSLISLKFVSQLDPV